MASNGPIQKNFFGMHVGNNGQYWPTIPIVGAWRSWDQIPAWPQQQPTSTGGYYFGAIPGTTANMNDTVNAAIANGAEPILTLGLCPPWAALSQVVGAGITGAGNPTNSYSAYASGTNSPPQNLQVWINYVTALGTHFLGRVTHYEIGNEVNDMAFFSGTIGGLNDSPSPGTTGYGPGSDMYNMVKAASIALKAIDPNIKILSPSFVGAAFPQMIALVKDLVPYIDVISFHFYTGGTTTNDLATTGNYFPENYGANNSQYNQMQQIRGILSAGGIPSTLPIWNTEFGFAMANADGTAVPATFGLILPEGEWQCAYVMRSLIIAAACGIERNYWYTWDNNYMGMIEPSTKGVGVLANQVVYKACVGALQAVQGWLIGRYVSDLMYDRGLQLWSCKLSDDNGFRGLLVWSTNTSPNTYTFPPGYKAWAKYKLQSQVLGGGGLFQSDAASLPLAIDPPMGGLIPNPVSLKETAHAAYPSYNAAYTTTSGLNTFGVVENPPPSNPFRVAYRVTHKQYSGYGVVTTPIPEAGGVTTMWFSPILLIA